MKIKPLTISDSFIIELESKIDNRGYFMRIFSLDLIKKIDKKFKIAQVNQSLSLKKGIIRGLHIQKKPKEEAKIIQCIKGEIFDVIIDLRLQSPTYGKWYGTILSEKNKRLIYVPKGCAHGFQSLANNTIVQDPVSQYYYPELEMGIRWNDPAFNIGWPIKKAIVSEKDAKWEDYKLK